jgi:hypothetical protein
MTPKCIPTLEVAFMWESQMFKSLDRKANKHQIEPIEYHWKGLEIYMPKFPLCYSFKYDMHEL